MTTLFGERLDDVLKKQKSKLKEMRLKKKKPYELLEWQHTSQYLPYHEHISNIEEGRWTRAPSPQEVFSLLIDHQRNKTSSYYSQIAENIIQSGGEYFCHAVKVKGKHLNVYENIWGVCYNDDGDIIFDANNTSIDRELMFNIGEQKKDAFCDIRHLPDEFIEYFYTMPLNKLPSDFQMGVEFFIPQEGRVFPLVSVSGYNYDICTFDNIHYSRGVREK